MAALRYALCNADGVIIDVVLWDGQTEWQLPDGVSFAAPVDNFVGPGWSIDNDGTWHPPAVEVAAVTADDVREEASRRMRVLLGARDKEHLSILVSNGQRESVRLLNKRLILGQAWTPDEAARAAYLSAVDERIELIRAHSNVLETDPPADYTADKHWPTF